MLIIGKPQELDMCDYIIVENDLSREIQLGGFMPKYYDSEFYYFVKSEELLEFIEGSKKIE